MTNDNDSFWEGFEMVSGYSRKQAMLDGYLVDCSNADFGNLCRELGIRVNVAMTSAAWAETIGGIDEPLPVGQSIEGRLWDVLYVMRLAMQKARDDDRAFFEISVQQLDGTRREVKLWALIGPGDHAEPVITIMLQGED